MICSKNAQNLAKNARHSAHHNFTRKCPKCPIFSLFPASSPPKMPTFMPKQKTHIPFFAQNIVKFCIFWAGPDNFWKCPKKGPGPTMFFSASKPFKMPDMGRNAHFWSPWIGVPCSYATQKRTNHNDNSGIFDNAHLRWEGRRYLKIETNKS